MKSALALVAPPIVEVGSVPEGKVADFLTGKHILDTAEEYVRLVDYPALGVLTVPPLTCVIAPGTGDRNGFAGQVVSAAEILAAS